MKIKIILLLSLIFALAAVQNIYAEEARRITKEELRDMIDDPDLVIIDIRTGRDWKSSEYKIKNAVREDPFDVETWLVNYDRKKTFVLYCA